MEYIRVTKENLEQEHICCAISNNKDVQVSSKKAWLAEAPQFKACARHPQIAERGYVLYYTSQCPFNAKYVPVLEAVAKEHGVPFKAIHLQNKSEAQNAPTPITTYAFFRDGEYLTNEQMNDKRFLKVING